jgi:hypothetical protein
MGDVSIKSKRSMRWLDDGSHCAGRADGNQALQSVAEKQAPIGCLKMSKASLLEGIGAGRWQIAPSRA